MAQMHADESVFAPGSQWVRFQVPEVNQLYTDSDRADSAYDCVFHWVPADSQCLSTLWRKCSYQRYRWPNVFTLLCSNRKHRNIWKVNKVWKQPFVTNNRRGNAFDKGLHVQSRRHNWVVLKQCCYSFWNTR